MADKYACLQQTQQDHSAAFVNGYGGSAEQRFCISEIPYAVDFYGHAGVGRNARRLPGTVSALRRLMCCAAWCMPCIVGIDRKADESRPTLCAKADACVAANSAVG
jgi:hypothetical protein